MIGWGERGRISFMDMKDKIKNSIYAVIYFCILFFIPILIVDFLLGDRKYSRFYLAGIIFTIVSFSYLIYMSHKARSDKKRFDDDQLRRPESFN